MSRNWNCLHYGNIVTLHVCTGTGTVGSTVTLQRCMFVQGLEMSAVGNIATLQVCTGTGTVCITVTLQRYMFVQGLELSAIRQYCNEVVRGADNRNE